MRHWFRDLPIRRKLALMTLASSVIALVFAAGGIFTWDVIQYRREIARDLTAQARTIGENSTASITFEDPRSAGETLAVLEIHPNVEYACMFRADGSLFATYFRDGRGACPAAAGDMLDVGWRDAQIIAPINFNGRRIGSVLIHRDLIDVIARLSVLGAIMTALLAFAVLLAALVGHRMQRTIADPLLTLAATARVVSDTKNYSLRGEVRSNDEVGTVVQAFNDMLDRVAGAERRAVAGQPAEGRVPGHALARAAHAAQRHPRVDPDRAVRRSAADRRVRGRSRASSATRGCRRG